MSLVLPRVLALWLALAAGAALGWLVGKVVHAPLLGLLGASAGLATLITIVDAWRGYHLMAWLRGAQEDQAPRDVGLWGELGYRVERSLRARERLSEQERARLQQFLSAIEASPNGVMMLDANDQIAWCNSQAADHFGIDPERDRLQRVTNLVRAPAFVGYLQSGQFDEAVEFASPHGHATLSVLVRPYGEGMRLVLSQDVTERDRTDAMRRDFVANVSHEIRTPLTVLVGFVETLDTVTLSTAEQARVLALMRQQAQRMQSLVDDLLTLAKLEGSPRPAADRWVAMDPLLSALQIDAQVLSAGRHRLAVSLQPGCLVAGIESELASAMGNLVSNAIRYTAEGGSIEISWGIRASDRCAEFEVRDNGIGIAREHIARLTERFYRVDGSRSRDTGGTGLGLAIVKHVVQRHGGELEIHSELGKGSRFKLVFPAARVRSATVDLASAVDSNSAGMAAAQ